MLTTLGNGKEFKFNFPVDELKQLELENKVDADNIGQINKSENIEETPDKSENEIVKQITYVPTDNSFRFNFDVSKLKSENN